MGNLKQKAFVREDILDIYFKKVSSSNGVSDSCIVPQLSWKHYKLIYSTDLLGVCHNPSYGHDCLSQCNFENVLRSISIKGMRQSMYLGYL